VRLVPYELHVKVDFVHTSARQILYCRRSFFGQNTRELEWFVKARMTPEQALSTATTNGAALLGMEKSLGAVAPGYFADIVAVEGDPMLDIEVAIRNVRWVMKGGKVVVDRTSASQGTAAQ
jgi:imidazolonepropionase-like amidohydrolase